MPVIHGKDIETISPFPGFELKVLMDKTRGAQSITLVTEILHPGTSIPIHKHKIEGAFYVLAGNGYLKIEGEDTYRIEPGMVCLVPANSWYTIVNDGSEDIKWITTHPAIEITREEKDSF